ncbi:carboxylate--amine ligase [Slackia heliotrinireducens]|uniref:carboxylate--amine ligase n=1 Tax=Slackia heliotrinireducens TaxID=84110 RepID=UPI0033153CA3
MTLNSTYTNEYLSIVSQLDGDVEGKRKARTYMGNSTAIYHGVIVDSAFVPRLFDAETKARFTYIAETTYSILCKVMQEYIDNPDYRHVYDFDERLVDLVLLPRNYDALLPFARVDVFLNEDTLEGQFCEFNGDGSSGMNENREITRSVEGTASYQEFGRRHKLETCTESLFGGWVREFLNIYSTYAYKVEHPHIAIVDFLENAIVDEFGIFCGMFEKAGYHCTISDVRDLTFDGEHLIDQNGEVIDAIWRRSVTNDIIEHWEESQPLIQAVRAEKVALIGSFAGHLVHDKQIFSVLFKPETQAILTDEENAFVRDFVPYTTFLDSECINLDDVKAERTKWIIKPTDGYGSADVYAGKDFDDAAWGQLIDKFANGAAGAPFLIQTYCTLHKTLTLPLYGEDADYRDNPALAYSNMSGVYIYNGRFAGVFSRLGPNPIISKKTRGITAASIWVDC